MQSNSKLRTVSKFRQLGTFSYCCEDPLQRARLTNRLHYRRSIISTRTVHGLYSNNMTLAMPALQV